MDASSIRALLAAVQSGELDPDTAFSQLSRSPADTLDCATIDIDRLSRTGQQEVVFGEGKRTADIVAILCKLRDSGQAGLVTRLDGDKARAIRAELPDAIWHDRARILELPTGNVRPAPAVQGVISVVCAGTSDLPVAEEAAVVAEFFGHPIERYWDVGVAGIHRILNHREALSSSACVIVIAGMEGALASVVGGLVPCPVVAVPTSVGYGANFGGLAALLGMLNSCAAGVSVVNIDNGFGAAMMAIRINRRMDR